MESAVLTQENQALQQQVSQLLTENKLLRLKVDALLKRLYGSSSEKISDQQMELLMAGLSEAPPPGLPPDGLLEKPSPSRPAAPGPSGRQGLPKQLETQE